MPKKNNTNTVSKEVSKKVRPLDYDEIFDFHDMKMKPFSERSMLALASEMRRWVKEHTEALKPDEFLVEKDIWKRDFLRWCGKCPELQAAYEYAKMVMGARRETGGLTRKLDGALVAKTMPMYDEEWVRNDERVANLKASQEQFIPEQKIVVLERYPESDLVPVKKTPEEVAARLTQRTREGRDYK